jgi:molybdopterin synthase sulfur carrier subunit
MLVEVRFFASLSDRTGRTREQVEIEPSADVATLWSLLVERHPSLAGLPYRPLVACDLAYSEWTQRLKGVREVAFLPPVSGG